MKRKTAIVLTIVIIPIILLSIILYLSQFHLDLSQDYRSIDGYENIVFKECGSDQCFHLCTWGLVKTESAVEFDDHRDVDTSSYEYQLIVEKTDAEDVWQVVPSPDGRYILYVERIDVGKGYTTDEEEVYFRVYSIADDTSITVYSGYRQYLLVDWK